MARLPRLAQRTFSPRVIRNDGGFAGLFQLDFANKLFARNYRDPVLVSCTDGVGTKLKVATLADKHDSVGIDLVAMSINDAICCGAEPLFFLDYVAMAEDNPERLEQIVKGVSDGCCQADCALLGGETAIMSDLYAPGDYDLAGFCVGVVERDKLIDGAAIVDGDVLLGVASSGLHSNGFSLVRKIVFEAASLSVDDHIDELGCTVGEELLRPTRIYARALRAVFAQFGEAAPIHGVAHITGGGLAENLQRILPAGISPEIQPGSWPVPAVFPWLQRLGEVDAAEMQRVFNMGVGLALVIEPEAVRQAQECLTSAGIESWKIGKVVGG
jgi:phosphoribosylformylglycinamidine cyclo-ligase